VRRIPLVLLAALLGYVLGLVSGITAVAR